MPMSPFYFSKRFESAHTGRRIIAVECDECGCSYWYELARIGTGARTAPYGIGQSAADIGAQEQSQWDLRERLAFEAELVPCPNCNWINEELIQGYRLGRFRWGGVLALGIGGLGTVGSLIGAWFISFGPPADRAILPFVLLGGPALSVSLSVAVLLLRRWLRSTICPNRDYPLAPRLPPGSPPALVKTAGGELRPAKLRDFEVLGAAEWHDFQLGRDQFPAVCCECMRDVSPGSVFRRQVMPAVELRIPHCAECAQRLTRTARRIGAVTASTCLLGGGAALLVLGLDLTLFWLSFGAWMLVSMAIAAYTASSLTTPVRIRIVDASRGVLRLRFRNPEYHPRLAIED